jgi:hypothetical protein
MCAVFMEDRSKLMMWLDMIEHSAVAGHDVAAFVLTLVLHRSNSGVSNDNIAQWWLSKVEGDEVGLAAKLMWKNAICTRPLQQAMFVLQDWRRVSLVLCLLWPCRCVARTDISAEVEAMTLKAQVWFW